MTRLLLFAVLILAGNAGAQDVPRDPCTTPIVSRLFPLEYIRNADAAKLVAPFVPGGAYCGVYEAGGAVRGVTVKAPKEIIDRVDSLLKANDKPPLTVVLRFQLIAALDSAGPADPAIQPDVFTSLQELFKFRTYRLVAQGAATVGNATSYEVTMAAPGERFVVQGSVSDIRARTRGAPGAPASSVAMSVSLIASYDPSNTGPGIARDNLLSTGLSTPIGQTVVLGSAAARGGRRALILTVRPELTAERR